jgi:hypothetical protein
MNRVLGRTATALAVAAALCLPAGLVPAQAAASPRWQLYRVYGKGANNIDAPFSDGLAAAGQDNAWAVFAGCNWPCPASSNIDFLDHWNGYSWTRVAARSLHYLDPQMVTASSSSDAWLFGLSAHHRYLTAVHWNGHSWTSQYVPSWAFTNNGSGELAASFADFGARDLWIFSEGGYIGQKSAYAARYLNGRWTKSYLPVEVDGVVALSSTDIWVAGRKFNGQGAEIFLNWNGHRWNKTALRTGLPGTAEALFTTGDRDLWLEWSPNPDAAPFLLRKSGSGWAKVILPRGYGGYLATGDGAHGVWLYGFAPGRKRVQVFLHWRAGHWTIFKVPNSPYQPGNVDAIAVIPGTTSMWATGNVYGPGDGTTLNRGAIWRYTA